MWQARQCLIMFISSFVFFSNFSWSQELPPGNLIVVTACEIAHGHSIDEVVTVARAIDYSSDGAPNAVFYRTPVSGSEFSPNWALGSFIGTILRILPRQASSKRPQRPFK